MDLKILLVDDDKRLRSVLENLLTEENHEVIACPNGLEAIERCQHQKFDLAITDLKMPGAGGMEVLKKIRKIHPDTLVILITGYASLESAVQAIREGAYDYITKPFKLEQFKIVVNNAREKIRLIRDNQRLFDELQEAYRQLNMVKKIMLERQCQGGDTEVQTPLIAGSLLPHCYIESTAGKDQPILTDLERIAALKDRGILSEAEFILCKSRLFKKIHH